MMSTLDVSRATEMRAPWQETQYHPNLPIAVSNGYSGPQMERERVAADLVLLRLARGAPTLLTDFWTACESPRGITNRKGEATLFGDQQVTAPYSGLDD